MATQHIEHLLKALQYPLKGPLDLSNKTLFQEIVHELEDKYIAALEPAERRTIEPTQDNRKWNNAFRQYLGELGCPVEFKASHSEGAVLEWLLQLAISYEFDALEKPEEETSNGGQSPQSWDSEQTKNLIKQLQQVLQIDSTSMNTTKKLQEIKSAVEIQAQAAELLCEQNDINGVDILSRNAGTLGFTSNEEEVDAAATLMRILYINDLRHLQSQIDDAIVSVQEYTQNPRANAKLGVVGR